jgi:hypothetical protein
MREAVARSFADRRTPRQRVVVGDRHGDREERRTLEASTEVVAYLRADAAGPAADPRAALGRAALGRAALVDPDLRIGEWPGLGQVCRLLREVEFVSGCRAGETTSEVVFAVTSLLPAQADPARLLALSRGHWQIENGLHWVRDVTLGEDASQVRSGQAPANLAACRNTCLGLLRRAGYRNVAAALRRHAMYPREALALLGIPLA